MLKAYSLSSDQMQLVAIIWLLLKVLKGQTTNPSLQYTCQKIAPISSLHCLSAGQIFSQHTVKLTSWKDVRHRWEQHFGDWRCAKHAGELLWETSALHREWGPLRGSNRISALHFFSQLNVFAKMMLSSCNTNPLPYCWILFFQEHLRIQSMVTDLRSQNHREVLY